MYNWVFNYNFTLIEHQQLEKHYLGNKLIMHTYKVSKTAYDIQILCFIPFQTRSLPAW